MLPLVPSRLFSILSLFKLFFSRCFWCLYSLAPVPGGVARASSSPTVRMEPVVRLPLPGRTLVEIRRSRAVVIAAGESCFQYGLFLQLLCSAQSVPGWRSRQRRHLGNVGGRNVLRWKGLISMYYI